MEIVDHLLRILDRRRLVAAGKRLARTLLSSCFQPLIIVGMNSKFLRQRLLPRKPAIATRALNSALCCFRFTPNAVHFG